MKWCVQPMLPHNLHRWRWWVGRGQWGWGQHDNPSDDRMMTPATTRQQWHGNDNDPSSDNNEVMCAANAAMKPSLMMTMGGDKEDMRWHSNDDEVMCTANAATKPSLMMMWQWHEWTMRTVTMTEMMRMAMRTAMMRTRMAMRQHQWWWPLYISD